MLGDLLHGWHPAVLLLEGDDVLQDVELFESGGFHFRQRGGSGLRKSL